jgi:hypothetical protein
MSIQALVLGFGGTGAHILTFLKELTVLRYGSQPESVRFLLFDTIADWEPGATVKILGGAAEEKLAVGREEGTSLDPKSEYFFLADRDPDLQKYVFEYLALGGNPEAYPHLKDWLHAPWLSVHVPRNQLNIKEGAAQQRQIGRFAMFQNAAAILQQIDLEIHRLHDRSGQSVVNVWVVGSAAGGTGAGCLLDAAFLARAAARAVRINLTGVIALPEIYLDKDGISPGRAYSLFRELDRVQEQGCSQFDRYTDGGMVSSRVVYDAKGAVRSTVASRLFDNLFYVGQPCRQDGERTSFFTSVANAIDPFLDESAGRPLLQDAINNTSAASSFGAARLYLPVETLADLFAWEEVAAYLEAAAAPRKQDGIVIDLQAGAVQDRQREGRAKIESLLPLFKALLELAGKTEREIRQFVATLSPAAIVKDWYGFGGAGIAGLALSAAEQQVARLTYVHPAISWSEDDPGRVPAAERTVKTHAENQRARGFREGREVSRDRFAAELEALIDSYKSRDGGERTFERGRRLVFDKLSHFLRARVDELVMSELQQNPRFGIDPAAPEQGTAITRLFQELKEILGDGGFLEHIDKTVGKFIDALRGEEGTRQQEAVRAINDLREWTPPLLLGSVEEPQQTAREVAGSYLEAYQKARLLQDMQLLVRAAKSHYERWVTLMRAMFDGLVLGAGRSALLDAQKQLKRLHGRLDRLAQNPTALISCAGERDVELQGYRERLRQECVLPDGRTSLSSEALAASSWQASVDAQGRPRLQLVLRQPSGEQLTGADTIGQLHYVLRERFRREIKPRLERHDIFDYLLYSQQEPRGVQPEQIARLLNDAAAVLINAEGAESCHLIYADPVDPAKRNLAAAIRDAVGTSLRNRGVSAAHHGDRFAITLLKIRKPSLDDIHNIRECRNDYLRWEVETRSRDEVHDQQLLRAQVFHAFRPELEAWCIERRHFLLNRHQNMQAGDLLPPRIVRLLEHPAMIQSFVHCVATGAVERTEQGWVWHDSANKREVVLTEREQEPRADLLRAAVVFALQQRENRAMGRLQIRLEDARRSADDRAKAKGCNRDQAVREFLDNGLAGYLRAHLSPGDDEGTYDREVEGMRLLFEFYGQAHTQPQLMNRVDLSYQA